MEKSSKAEYVAVPTSDVEQEVGLPPYEEQEAVTADKTKSRRRFRFMLIGGAITLLGLTHLCTSGPNGGFGEMRAMDVRPQDAPEPCALRHLDQYNELKNHMDFLEYAFGEPRHEPWNSQPSGEHRPHYKHHKDFEEKHHKNHDEFASLDGEEKPHHRKHPHGDGHRRPEDEQGEEEPHHRHPHQFHGEGHHRLEDEDHRRPEGEDKPHHRHHHPEDKKAQAHDEGHHRTHGEGHRPHHQKEEGENIEGAVQKFDGDHKKFEPFCKAEDLISSSSIFEFSPEEFKRAGIFSGGFFDRGSHVILSKSTDSSLKNVRVNVTVSAGRDDLAQEVKVSAFDHDGEYSVQVEHGHFHHPRRHAIKNAEEGSEEENGPKKENCLIYDVAIEFPANLDYFDQLNVKAKGGAFKGGKGIEGIEFGSIRAAIGHGAVIFDGLRAKNLMLGVFKGVVMGTYQPSETFSAGAIHGAAKVKIEPTSDNVNITASATFGPASVDIPADSYKGRFTLFNLFGDASTVEAPNPEDIHVQKFKPTIKSGYYKEDNEQSRIVVAAKLKGGERLTFY